MLQEQDHEDTPELRCAGMTTSERVRRTDQDQKTFRARLASHHTPVIRKRKAPDLPADIADYVQRASRIH